jgi:hypothetical protein
MAACRRLRPFHLGVLVLVGACQPAQEDGVDPPAATASGTGDAEPAPTTELTCSDPVGPRDTAASLQERYGDQARAETLHGPEGIEFPGLVLWPDDPARRIEVVFAEEGQRTVSSVDLSGMSAFRVAGLAIGDPLARANAANGKPFKLWGFSWDYGGYVSDLEGGKLAALPGGCRVVMRVDPHEDAEVPDALVGEVELSSDDPRLEAAGVTIEELSLAF